ncbi:hypothetical protein C2G38_2212870 [Gigaspora rosea]|uniref:Uncharacterized protein n=1 Tax=Gigaspora rosea TaxID=44941 RepID=A0A397UFK8_9GLOM|nr:hypothetical protein C2G38_2212870 [Gigaspora rosea]
MSGDKAVYDRKIKKAKTLVTEEENLNAIWRTCCSNKENEELFPIVVKDSDGKAEQATLTEGKNSLFTQTNNTSQVPAKQTVHVPNSDNNSKHMDEHVNDQSSEDNGQVKPRQWSNLFSKLERGKATFSTYAPRKRIHIKNKNALIFEVHSLKNISTTDIVKAMTNSNSMLWKVLQSLCKPYREQIKEAFQDIGNISSIKPLVYKGTSVLTNQWVVIFETTDDSDLASRIPRFTHIWDQKEYQEYKASVELREMQKERKLQRTQERKQLRSQEQSPSALSIKNPYNEEFKNVMIIESPTADLATPSMEVDKEVKVEDQSANKGGITILAGDFNTKLDPHGNRISRSPPVWQFRPSASGIPQALPEKRIQKLQKKLTKINNEVSGRERSDHSLEMSEHVARRASSSFGQMANKI